MKKTDVYVSKTSGLKVKAQDSSAVVKEIGEESFPVPRLDLLKGKEEQK